MFTSERSSYCGITSARDYSDDAIWALKEFCTDLKTEMDPINPMQTAKGVNLKSAYLCELHTFCWLKKTYLTIYCCQQKLYISRFPHRIQFYLNI